MQPFSHHTDDVRTGNKHQLQLDVAVSGCVRRQKEAQNKEMDSHYQCHFPPFSH